MLDSRPRCGKKHVTVYKGYVMSNAIGRLIRRTAVMLPRSRPSPNGKDSKLDHHPAAPRHLVIIPDGNRRWAKARGVPAFEGHRKGARVVEDLVWRCRDAGVKVLTLWGFSTENWGRDEDEIEYLMELFVKFLTSVEGDMRSEQVQFRHLGRKDRLPAELLTVIERLEKETADHTNYYLNVCIDYGGRDEILRAVKRALNAGVTAEELDEENLEEYLDTGGLPDPDLIIRTSGEYRLSGILPFQSVYSELAFVPLHLPDMTKEVLEEIFDEYAQRRRRYGK